MSHFQVVGRGAWLIDYPHEDAINHKTGDVFEARPDNSSVIRGLRQGRLRQLEPRECAALDAAKLANMLKPAPAPAPKASPKSAK